MTYTPNKRRPSHTHTHDRVNKILYAVAATCAYTAWALVLFLVIFTLANL